MRVAIRADASGAIGLGHLQRGVSLAHALREAGAEVTFITRALGYDSAGHVTRAGFAAVASEAALGAVDWLVVDHYELDARWHEQAAASLGARVAVIDDLADRPLHADVLVDVNLAEPDHATKYAGRIDPRTSILGGPRYALLGPSFAEAPRYQPHATVRSIGIFMGGTDPANLSAAALLACREQAGFSGPIELVTTRANPHLTRLRALAARWPQTAVIVELPELSGFFARHDLQLGAGGGATWERCCIGAPALTLVGAPNQLAVVPPLARVGASATLAQGIEATAEAIGQGVAELLRDSARRNTLASKARALVDGRGAQRVALKLLGGTLRVRAATTADSERMLRWRNDPVTRALSRNSGEIGRAGHEQWLASTLADGRRLLLAGEVGGIPVGFVRFDRLDEKSAEVSLYLDPGLQGLGLGGILLNVGEDAARRWVGPITFVATVLDENPVSRRMFEAAGYSFEGQGGKCIKHHV